MAEIMSLPIDQIAALHLLTSSHTKDDVLALVDRLAEAQRDAEAATAELREQEAANQAMLDEANEKLAAAEKMRTEVEDEKRRFTEVRAAVEQQHREREADLSRHASSLAQHEDDLTQREADLGQREAAVVDREKKNAGEAQRLLALGERYDRGIEKLRARAADFMAALDEIE